jgi:predicted aspartyl protease
MARGDRVPFVPNRTLVTVHATLNASGGVYLIVDSGAERTVTTRRAASVLGIDLTRPLRTEPLTGLGQTAAVPVVQLDRVQVGASAAERLLASVCDLPPSFRADGLLGLNFLSRFRVAFEFDTRTLVLRPPPARQAR